MFAGRIEPTRCTKVFGLYVFNINVEGAMNVEGAQCCQEPGAVCWHVTQCGQAGGGFRLVSFLFIAYTCEGCSAHTGHSIRKALILRYQMRAQTN